MYPLYSRMWGEGLERRLFDIMVLGVGAHLGQATNKSISAYSRT